MLFEFCATLWWKSRLTRRMLWRLMERAGWARPSLRNGSRWMRVWATINWSTHEPASWFTVPLLTSLCNRPEQPSHPLSSVIACFQEGQSRRLGECWVKEKAVGCSCWWAGMRCSSGGGEAGMGKDRSGVEERRGVELSATLPCFASIHARLPWEPFVCCEASFTLTPLPAFTLSLCDFLFLFIPFNKVDRNGRQHCSQLRKEFSQNLSEGMWGRETVGPSWGWLKSWGLIYKQVLGSILKTHRDREALNSVSKKKVLVVFFWLVREKKQESWIYAPIRQHYTRHPAVFTASEPLKLILTVVSPI